MFKLLQLALFGHAHTWTIIDKREIVEHNATPPYISGVVYHQQCTSCGAVKAVALHN